MIACPVFGDVESIVRLTRWKIIVGGLLLLWGGSLSSCSKHRGSLPPDLSISPRRISAVPSAARIRGGVPTTTVRIPGRPISHATGNNPWKSQAPPRNWKYIVLHHTASESGSVEGIHEAHLGRGWEGIGYHFVIGNGNGMDDGLIEPTFRWREQMHGAHAGKSEYNQFGIGVVLVGNFEETYPTAAQLTSVKRLVTTLKREYGIATGHVIPHRDVKSTECPGKHFPLTEVATGEIGYNLSQRTLKQSRLELAGRLGSSKR